LFQTGSFSSLPPLRYPKFQFETCLPDWFAVVTLFHPTSFTSAQSKALLLFHFSLQSGSSRPRRNLHESRQKKNLTNAAAGTSTP
jgi:hypothetical protein